MSIAQTLIDLILVPGSSLRLVPVINVALVLLLGLIIAVGVYIDIGSVHIFVLSFLSLGLFLSVNWFAVEYQKVKDAEQRAEDLSIGDDARDQPVVSSKKSGKGKKSISSKAD